MATQLFFEKNLKAFIKKKKCRGGSFGWFGHPQGSNGKDQKKKKKKLPWGWLKGHGSS